MDYSRCYLGGNIEGILGRGTSNDAKICIHPGAGKTERDLEAEEENQISAR